MGYQENEIFYQDDEYSARAEFCNLSGLYHIEEIEADEKGRRFKIVKNSDNSIQNEIDELKQKLADTDYEAIKFAEKVLTEEEFAPIRVQREQWRARINELEQ